MMGRQSKVQSKLFYTAFNLEQRVRKNHILRKVKRHIDFDFIYNEVKDTYGINGNESVAPPIILKMMMLLIFYNLRSERELAATIPERLDWLWFLDYDLDDDIPNHSVLSKARARWRRLWRVQIQEYLRAAIQNIKILMKDVKEPAPALSMQVAKAVRNKASRTKPYGLGQLFNPQCNEIAGFFLSLSKNTACHPAQVIG